MITLESKRKSLIGELETTTMIQVNDDLTMDQLFDTFRSFALALGYHPETVSSYFDGEESIDE